MKGGIENYMKQPTYDEITKNVIEFFTVLSSKGQILYISSNCCHYLGYEQDELIGKKLKQYIHNDDIYLVESIFFNDHQVHPCTLRFLHKNGPYIWLEANVEFVNNELKERPEREVVLKFTLFQSDVPLIKAHSTQYTSSSSIHIKDYIRGKDSSILERLPCPIFISVNGKIKYINLACLELLGVKVKDEILGKEVFDFIHPHFHDVVKKRINQLRNGLPVGIIEQIWKRAEGNLIDVETRSTLIDFQDEKAELVVVTDISSRKRFQNKLQKSRERYQRLIQNSIDTIAVIYQDKWVFMNESGIKLFGVKDYTDIIGQNIYSYLNPEYHLQVKEIMQKVSDGHMEVIVTKQIWTSFSGENVFTEMVCIPTTYFGEPAVQVILRDLTDRKQAEEMMLQSEKLSVAGQLAAGIAHEIRNPLTSIKGFLQLMQSDKCENEQYFEIIFSELNRIELILSELLMLAKPQESKFKKENINNILNEITTLLETEANLKNVLIEKKLSSTIPEINCDQNQLKQVFINFIKNAIEAMPKGGVVSVTTKEVENEIEVTVKDNGIGIPKKILEKIGQPFVTTKKSGTGLGLMISFKIIENHKGTIKVNSEEGKGTTFTIRLPIKRQELSEKFQ